MPTHFDHVCIGKKATIGFDGKCISYDLGFPGLARKTLGVLLPALVKFDADSAETLEIVAGACKIRIAPVEQWTTLEAGQRLEVPGATSFEIEALLPLHYVRHYANT